MRKLALPLVLSLALLGEAKAASSPIPPPWVPECASVGKVIRPLGAVCVLGHYSWLGLQIAMTVIGLNELKKVFEDGIDELFPLEPDAGTPPLVIPPDFHPLPVHPEVPLPKQKKPRK
jgi:hypothetical protein